MRTFQCNAFNQRSTRTQCIAMRLDGVAKLNMRCVTKNSPSRRAQKVEESGNTSGVHRSHHLLLGRNHVCMPFFRRSSHVPSPNVLSRGRIEQTRGAHHHYAQKADASDASTSRTRRIAYIQTRSSAVKRNIW